MPDTPPLHKVTRRSQWLAGVVIGTLFILASLYVLVLGLPYRDQPLTEPTASQERSKVSASYTEDKVCFECHTKEAAEWSSSHHAKAMEVPTAHSVLGNFNDAKFTHQGKTTRFYKRNSQFMVLTDGADGRQAEFAVKYTFGYQPLQQYLIELPGGRLQALSIAWDSDKRRWFHLLPDEKAPPGDVLHWTGNYQTANTMCIVCHTTGYRKNYDSKNRTFESTWTSLNVTCQACHGPGDSHVAWAKSEKKPSDSAQGTHRGFAVTTTSRTSTEHRTEICTPCHARRSELTALSVPGEALMDHFRPSLLGQGLYFPDGQQLEEVYVDGSFRQSKMFQKGVTCTDCHNPHTNKLRQEGNGVCLQCHSAKVNSAFPAATGRYDDEGHHHHKPGTPGAQCVNCHMPSRTYMGIQKRPDHSLRVPRPDLSEKSNSPNACNTCHTDKSAPWAAEAIGKWFGPVRKQGAHYGEVINAYRQGQASDQLLALLDNKSQPAIVRATALAELANDTTTGIHQRVEATHSPEAEMRAAAAESLERVPHAQRVPALTPLLTDPVKAVRMAATRGLSSVPAAELDATVSAKLEKAVAEYLAVQELSADMPGAQLNMATMFQNRGDASAAETHLLEALHIDPDFTPARLNLAQLYSLSSRLRDAENVLRTGAKRTPGVGEIQYALGLLLAEASQLPEAVKVLSIAAKLQPSRPRVHYNLGLAQQHLGNYKAAEHSLLAAQKLAQADPVIAYALAVLYLQAGQIEKSRSAAQTLQALNPSDPNLRPLLARLQ